MNIDTRSGHKPPLSNLQSGSKTSIFLLPGVFGDEPQLSYLREHLAHRLSFHTINLPDIRSPIPTLSSIPKTAGLLVVDIVRLQPHDPVYIVGFSFGASLALEVASQLKRADRKIAYLGLIDAPLKVKNLRQIHSLTPAGIVRIARRVVQKTNERRNLRNAQRKVLQGLALSDQQRRSFLLHLRTVAIDDWKPQRCEARGLIVFSDLMYKRTHEKWLTLCPNCKHMRMPSDHEHIIKGESLDRVASALADDIADVAGQTEAGASVPQLETTLIGL